MRYAALLASSLLTVLAIPATAQNNVVNFQSTIVANTCAGLLMNWGCVPPLLPGDATTYSCTSTGVTFLVWNSWWTTSATIPPGYHCRFMYCGPGGTHLQCNSVGHRRGKTITLKATPVSQH
jgi:hypothetical protein